MSQPIAATTRLLQRMSQGDAAAEAELLPRVYDELHRLAAHYMSGGGSDHTLQPTALVNEAYLRMTAGEGDPDFESREHFVGVAARAMRSVLVDHARRRRAAKRGGDQERVGLDAVAAAFEERAPDLVELDAALERLAAFDADGARVVELRFFAGLESGEIGELLGVSERTVRRQWQVARLWLRRELG